MKIFLIFFFLFAMSSFAFSQQCPPSVLKIQSPICDTPKNLNVSNIKCTTTQLNWEGNKEQRYIVKATGTDNAGNTVFTTDSANYNCNESGNCNASIEVIQGATLNWSVQAICNINGVIIYSPIIEAKETVIPYCRPIAANAKTDSTNNTSFRVYPNPTTGFLNIEYYSNTSGIAHLKVMDVNGKTLYVTSNNTRAGNNIYNLNLRNLSTGSYLLELTCAGNISKAKFVVAK